VETVTRACLWCQSSLEGRDPRTRYCNQRCRERFAYLQKNPKVQRSCPVCSADMTAKKRHAVYCSRPCKARAAEQRLRTGTEAGRARNAERYRKERARRIDYARRQYWANPDASIAYSKEWRKANPEKRRVQHENRRALKVGNGGYIPITSADWERIRRRFNFCCAYCGVRPEKVVMDHVVPLSRGGRHSPSNVLPACPACNGSKYAKFLSEWRLKAS
jgi:5-methylcytosine-specific restriction endonuclease McrA